LLDVPRQEIGLLGLLRLLGFAEHAGVYGEAGLAQQFRDLVG
jgi:hypothetical protein